VFLFTKLPSAKSQEVFLVAQMPLTLSQRAFLLTQQPPARFIYTSVEIITYCTFLPLATRCFTSMFSILRRSTNSEAYLLSGSV